MPLFEPLGGEAEIKEAAKRAKRTARKQLKTLYQFAIDYLENRQFDDVARELGLSRQRMADLARGQLWEKARNGYKRWS